MPARRSADWGPDSQRDPRSQRIDFGISDVPVASGVQAPDGERDGAILERLPDAFSSVWLPDHLQWDDDPVLESWTRLSFLAGAYPRFRFGHLVLAQGFRNPALLAKMAASLDRLTNGRFVLGLGAGWKEDEYRAYGYAFPTGGVRVSQLAESIELIRALWSGQPTTYRGAHYHVEDAICQPAPTTPIPILVGTNGPRALRVVARLADAWNWDGPWEEYRAPYETLRAHCSEVGRPIDQIVLTAQVKVNLIEADLSSALTIGPSAPRVIDELRRLEDVGVSHVQVIFANDRSVDRFIDDVLPAFD